MGVGLIAAMCLWSQAAWAQQDDLDALLQRYSVVVEGDRRVIELTLAEVLALSLERSLLLRSVRISEDIARSGLIAAEERNNPTLTNSLGVGRSVTAFPSFGRGSRADVVTFSSKLSKTLSSGIELSATFNEERQDVGGFDITTSGEASNFDSPTTFETSQFTGAVSVPIFQDFGSEVNDIPVRLAEVSIRGSRNDTRQAKFDLLRTVASTYWDLVGLRETISVEEDAVRLSQQLLEDNRQRLRAGVVSPADVTVSESQLATDRQNLLEVRVGAQRIEDQVRAALNLGRLDLGLKPVEEPTLREGEFDLEAVLEKTFRNDPALANLEQELQRNRFELAEALNEDDTDLDLDLAYTLKGFGKDTSDATSNLTNTDLQGYGVTLTWTVPLFDHATAEGIRQKQLERTQIALRVDDLKSQLTVRVQAVRRLLALADEEVNTARVSVSLQQELLQNEIARFRLGESTSFQVAQIQQDFSRAREREILSRIRYEKIFLELLLVSGDIFAQYGLPEDIP